MKALTFYLGHPDYLEDLKQELTRFPGLTIEKKWGSGFLCSGQEIPAIFAQNIWKDCHIQQVQSISDAQKFLRSKGKNWVSYKVEWARRMSLIEEGIHCYDIPELKFPTDFRFAQPSAWTLTSEKEIIYSEQTDSYAPLGEWKFIENKKAPSRAFLKLWETFLRIQKWPSPGDLCVDFGSSPGGWTYVLNELKTQTISIDRASLSDELLNSPLVKHLSTDAFKVSPNDLKNVTWIFSDLICYPDKLHSLVERWLAIHPQAHFVCTIKFQGSTDFDSLDKFLKIPGSQAFHLSVNKHEVTWVRLSKTGPSDC